MAEGATSSTSSTPSTTTTSSTPALRQFIAASADDERLEPDAMRGSEHLLQGLDIEDMEAERRKRLFPTDKKSS